MRLEDLKCADRPALKDLWAQKFKTPPPKSIGNTMMRRVLAYQAQAKAHGDLDRATKRALNGSKKAVSQAALAPNSQGGARPGAIPPFKPQVRPAPGTRLMREWNGKTHVVDVLPDGFDYLGKTYTSLSQIAKAITDAHWSGPRFFGLTIKAHKPKKPTRSAS